MGQIQYIDQKNEVEQRDKTNQNHIFVIQTHADKDPQNNYKKEGASIIEEFYLNSQPNQKTETKEYYQQQYLLCRLQEEIKKEKARNKIKITQSEKILYEEILNKGILSKNNSEVNNIKSKIYVSVKTLLNKLKKNGYSDNESFLRGELYQLHQHGEVLYYKNDPNLQDIVWLNPEVIVSKIHQDILGKGIIKKEKGVIPSKEFDKILENEEKIKHLLIREKIIYKNKRITPEGITIEEYIIPSFLPLAEEDEMFNWLKLSFLQPNLTLKFEDFIPFGLINQLICYYGQGKNELKKYWRDQLFFTMVNESANTDSPDQDKEELLNSRMNHPTGSYMVWISLNHEGLTIKTHIKPIESKNEHQIPFIERQILEDILDMYWDNIPDTINKRNMAIRQNKHFRLRKEFPIEDLYISIPSKNVEKATPLFARLADIDSYNPKNIQEGKNILKGSITAYPLINGALDKGKPVSISPRSYQHLTNNKNIAAMKRIFISYSKADKDELETCLKYLKPFEDEGKIEVYYDKETPAGDNIHSTIKEKILDSDYVIALVSQDFLTTDYITKIELPLIKGNNKKLYPLIIRPCTWEFNPIIKDYYVCLKGETEIPSIEKIITDGMWKDFIKEFNDKILTN